MVLTFSTSYWYLFDFYLFSLLVLPVMINDIDFRPWRVTLIQGIWTGSFKTESTGLAYFFYQVSHWLSYPCLKSLKFLYLTKCLPPMWLYPFKSSRSLAEFSQIPVVMTNQVRSQSFDQISRYSFQGTVTSSILNQSDIGCFKLLIISYCCYLNSS